MKRDRFSSVGSPIASILLRNLWSSVVWISAIRAVSRPRSITMPVFASGVPRTVTSARKEWPWISWPASPSVVIGSEWAASKLNDLVSSHIVKHQSLSDPDYLVRLQAEPPLRMRQAVFGRARGVGDDIRPVHRLQREALEGQAFEVRWGRALLRIDQLQLMALPEHELGSGLGADADPVDPCGRGKRAV